MNFLRGLLAAGYPLLVWAGLAVLEPRVLALALAALLASRALARSPSRAGWRPLLVPALALAGVLAVSVVWNDERGLRAVPVLVNGALLFAFARSLRRGPPIVETFARLQVPDLPPDEVRYCRRVTGLWCVFFAANAGVCAVLALAAPRGVWAAWTGLGAYLAVGVLYAAEFTVRALRFGRDEGTLVAPLFRRLRAR